jgi:multidrug efflux pump subunit AcrA (membrane-fusion protein)
MHTRSLVFLLTCLGGCSQAAEAAVPQPVPVKVQVVAAHSGSTDTRYSGTLEPAVRVDMAFRVGGYVEVLSATRRPKPGVRSTR